MELWDVLRRRKMVRHYRPDPVPPEVIDRVMASVRHAPSAGFTQGNEFLVLTTPDAIADYLRLTEDPAFPTPDEWADAIPPVVVFPLSNRGAYLARYAETDKIAFGLDDPDKWPAPFWDIDAGMASMLILLAAIDAGLGGLFAGIAYGERSMLDHFGVPAAFHAIGVIWLGYPADVDPLAPTKALIAERRRPVAQLVHHNTW
jgi:nitroreductase